MVWPAEYLYRNITLPDEPRYVASIDTSAQWGYAPVTNTSGTITANSPWVYTYVERGGTPCYTEYLVRKYTETKGEFGTDSEEPNAECEDLNEFLDSFKINEQ